MCIDGFIAGDRIPECLLGRVSKASFVGKGGMARNNLSRSFSRDTQTYKSSAKILIGRMTSAIAGFCHGRP